MSTPEERCKTKRPTMMFDPRPSDSGDQIEIRIVALTLADMIECFCPVGEEQSESIRKLRECVMWADAAIDMKS